MREHLATLLCNAAGTSYAGGSFVGPVADRFFSMQELIEENMEPMLNNCDTYWCILGNSITPSGADVSKYLDHLDLIASTIPVEEMYEWLTPYDGPWWEIGKCPAGNAGILWVAFMQVLTEVSNTYLGEI